MQFTILDGPSGSGLVSSGTVYPCRFLYAGSTIGTVMPAITGQLPIGISQEGRELPPTDSNYNSSYAGTSGTYPDTGDLIAYYGYGRRCNLELGTTISTLPTNLGPDVLGRGVSVTSTTPAGAIALATGVAGDYVPVIVVGGLL